MSMFPGQPFGPPFRLHHAALAAALLAPAAMAQSPSELAAELRLLKQQLTEQQQRIESLQQEVSQLRAASAAPAVPADVLEAAHGTGPAIAATVGAQAGTAAAAPQPGAPQQPRRSGQGNNSTTAGPTPEPGKGSGTVAATGAATLPANPPAHQAAAQAVRTAAGATPGQQATPGATPVPANRPPATPGAPGPVSPAASQLAQSSAAGVQNPTQAVQPVSAPAPAPAQAAAQQAPAARPVQVARAQPGEQAQQAQATAAAAARPVQPGTQVGAPPRRDNAPPEVAPLFEQPGVLTPRGKMVFEPSYQFGYSSSNRVALVGYTIIPALLIGLVDVREVKRNTSTVTLTLRRGLTNRLEMEARVPYVYRSDSTVSRELFTGTAVEKVFETSGRGLGDLEVGARYQLNKGGAEGPFYIGGLRFKSRTGRDPFEVVTDCQRRCVGDNVSGTGLPLDLPTGSGFYSLQPSLTALFASDPAVFFGSVSYLYNFKRKNVTRQVLAGETEALGDIKPGDVVGFNFGMGLALNPKTTLSIGYDHSSVGRMRQAGVVPPGSVRTQLSTLLIGYSYRLSDKRTVNLSVGAGLTRDTPDVSLNLRIPTNF
jgi:hypothetical protein